MDSPEDQPPATRVLALQLLTPAVGVSILFLTKYYILSSPPMSDNA